jgi:hypothetical protein
MRRVEFFGRETKLLQTQILELRAQERRLLTRRNALAPLCNLPTEVLLDILDLLSARILTNHAERQEYKRGRGRVGWVGVMGTCTRMRSLVLNTPRLWADVNLNRNEEWARLCLERSISFHLQVSFDEKGAIPWRECRCSEDEIPSIPKDQVLRLNHSFETSFPRASILNLNFQWPDQLFHAACDVLRAPSLPYLRSLTYTMDYEFFIDDGFLSDDATPVLRGATALTHLVLNAIKFLPPGLSLPSLVHFELKTDAGPYTQVDLFSFLRRSPLLEHLCVDVRYSRRPPIQPPNVEPIHLPRLLTLDLKTKLSCLMSHLSALPPPQDKLCVSGEAVLYNSNDTAHGDATTSLKEVFIYMWDMLDVTQKTPVVEITNTHAQEHSSLELTHPGTRIHTVVFSCTSSIRILRSLLDPVRSIRVAGPYRPGLWDWATTDPLLNLASAESVAVAHMCDERVQASLCAWLLARTDVNRRIRVLDLRGCTRQRQPDCVCDEAEKDSLQRMAPELRDAGLAEMVLVEGRALV